ncbi:MAG: DUF429 domain-containing protein [Planctomycetes bacterium]|nr:DUF429 domain-containing protein [Planctomycetota bacterium]
MIQKTFRHIRGIGEVRERLLWKNGTHTWGDMESALREGIDPRDLLRSNERQTDIFRDGYVSSSLAQEWLDVIQKSKQALDKANYDFFLSRLPAEEHWRLFPECLGHALYLDIETTGLSKEANYVTVIGALFQGELYQWVWPEPLDELWELIDNSSAVVTFNGRRFDIPFLRAHFERCPDPKAHIDLLYVLRKAGIRGGQKASEEQLGLSRPENLEGVDGGQAVVLWSKALYGDESAYHELLLYNRYDVEMLAQLAQHVYQRLADEAMPMNESLVLGRAGGKCTNHCPASFSRLRKDWHERQPGSNRLYPAFDSTFRRWPVVVGIDLRGKPKNPTGWVRCEGSLVESHVLYHDEEILEATIAAKPDLVSIDAPLFLPRGRQTVSDDSPCREAGGIVRNAERILWSRHIPVYPALIRHMQGLTQRGIELAAKLRERNIPVIESYPGAAQDILNIPRKGLDQNLLRKGLEQFGFEISGEMTHDELDAVTSALVGYFYLADDYEGIGAEDEGYMIVPKAPASMRWADECIGAPNTSGESV